MAGLIPIECKVSNYGVCGDNNDVIINKEWASRRDVESEDFYLAGFIDEDNLWQEPSRVLFSENEFTVYARLDSPSPGKDWSRLKLVDILNSVFPDAAQEIENLPSSFSDSDSSGNDSSDFEDTVREYLETLESQADGTFPDGAIDDTIGSLEDPIVVDSYGEKEDTLQEAEEALENQLPDHDLDHYLQNIPRKRSEFLEEQSNEARDLGRLPTSQEDDKIYLETNFIAIYW